MNIKIISFITSIVVILIGVEFMDSLRMTSVGFLLLWMWLYNYPKEVNSE